jgi:hypothetical protein
MVVVSPRLHGEDVIMEGEEHSRTLLVGDCSGVAGREAVRRRNNLRSDSGPDRRGSI